MRKEFFRILSESLTTAELQAVKKWWERLKKQEQEELNTLYDNRQDSCRFTLKTDKSGKIQWKTLPVLIQGEFVEDPPEKNEGWTIDFYEYLINHPEIFLLSQFREQWFHICTNHEKIKECLKTGIVPAEFSCPLLPTDCFATTLLKQQAGRSLFLHARSINIFLKKVP